MNIELEQFMNDSYRDLQISILEKAIKFCMMIKNQDSFEQFKTLLGNPRELLNTQITEIESFEIKENGDKLQIVFNLVQ